MNIHNYSLEQIKALIVEGSDLLVITSPASPGKDALSGQVESTRDPYWRTSLILANENTNIESLSHEIIKQAIPDQFNDNLSAVSQVHKYLEYSALNGILPVIIVDDAHKLSLEVLKFILQLVELRYSESLFRIVLFADETINEHLDVPELKSLTAGVIRNIYTTSFAKEEIEKEIEEEPTEIIGEITLPHDETDKVDEIDEYLFEEDDVLETNEKETSRSLIGLFILIIGLISAFLAYSYLNDQTDADVTEATIVTQPQETISGETVAIEEVIAIKEDRQELEDENELIDEDDLIIDDQLSEIVSEPSTDEDISEDILNVEVTETEEIIKTPYEELSDYVDEEETAAVEDETIALMPETKIDTDDKNIFNLKSVPENVSDIKGPVWLRQQLGSSYVLQLMSAQHMSSIKNLLSDQSGIQDQLAGYVKYTPSGKPRYLLLYGIYPDKKTAQAAINDLPEDLQSISPWPRAINDVINELDGISEPFIEIEEGIVIPMGEYSGEIEKKESPAIKDEEVLMPETNTGNLFNLATVPEYLRDIKGEAWLRQQPANSYVLQLMSAQYMSNIKNLLRGQSGIKNELSGYVKYTPSGKPRYLLLYGVYPDKASAKAAINDLPAELQSIPPWPRRLGDAVMEINSVAEPLPDEEMSEGLLGLG